MACNKSGRFVYMREISKTAFYAKPRKQARGFNVFFKSKIRTPEVPAKQ